MARKLPVKLAEDVLKQYDLEQVIVLCKDKEGTHHFVTYGKDKQNCKEAALSADSWKKWWGWPANTLSRYTQEIQEEARKAVEK